MSAAFGSHFFCVPAAACFARRTTIDDGAHAHTKLIIEQEARKRKKNGKNGRGQFSMQPIGWLVGTALSRVNAMNAEGENQVVCGSRCSATTMGYVMRERGEHVRFAYSKFS